ncbi:hypothetical protein NS183_07910 [Microbacterium testaceum]|uniref:hypothetical protein n=1 Tax=Microbacterium testaceum TaxID=2033 RepID=UPI00079A4FEB|nr:hypothetical protein [Microbacterium testaceum]KTS90695.1 hypothetical protein NS183_07910 [Microbacterium testaceum]
MDRIRQDHATAQQQHEDAMWHRNGHTTGLGVTPKQYHRASWWAAVEYVLNLQHAVDTLPIGEVLTELRKGNGSIYAPVLAADPKIKTQCPRCDMWTVIDVEGICGNCTYEFQEND